MQKLQKFKKTELGEIPEEWFIDKLGNFVDILVGYPFPSKEYSDSGIRLVRGDNVTEGKLRWGDRTRYWNKVTPQLKKFLLKKDDFLIGMDGSKVGKNYARVREDDLPCLLVQRVACLRVNDKLTQNYLDYIIGNKDFINYVESTKTNAAIPHISSRQISDYKIIVPTVKEQQKIASILLNVDDLLKKIEQIIEQTQRLKKGLMQRLLTKGIRHTKFKKTELGEIPEEWNIVQLKDISLKFISGGTPSTFNSDFWNGEIPWIRSAWITNKYVFTGERFITKQGLENSATNIVPKENVIIATRVSIGNIAINKIDIAINQDLTGIVVDKSKVSSEYLYWILRKHNQRIKFLSQGSTILGITREDLITITIPKPSLEEQKKIATLLSNVDESIIFYEIIKEKIENLKKGLMQQLLTGKIRVKV